MSGGAHSKLGASSAERWINCPGSVALCAAAPEQPESPYAKEGTVAHRVAELCLLEVKNPPFYVGKEILGVTVTRDMSKAVQVYIDHVRSVKSEGGELRVEQKVHLKDFDDELFGTNDAAVEHRQEGVLHAFDYKHGAGVPVVVEDNPQLKYYALGALMAAGGGFDRVVLHVVQPRCSVGGDPVRTWEISSFELLEFGLELAAAAKRTREKDAKLNAGKWCRFCRASGTCPALYNGALEAASLEFSDTTAALPVIDEMSSEEAGRRYELLDRLETWASAFRAHVFNEALRGRPPIGTKLVAKRANRKWKSDEMAISEALVEFPELILEDVVTQKPVSPAQLEKLVGAKYAKEFLAKHSHAPSSGFSLVPSSDKREAVTSEALLEFEAIEDFSND